MHNVQQWQCSIFSFFFFSSRNCERLLTARKFETRSVDLHLTESKSQIGLMNCPFFIVLKSFMELKPRGYLTLFRHIESWCSC